MRIYLDHNASAPLGLEVREAMLPFLGPPANPSSAHREGARARSALEAARAQVAALVGAAPAEIVFTSGATEANNLALRGAAAGQGIVTTAIEHASVLETARAVGAPLTVVPVDGGGRGRRLRAGGGAGPRRAGREHGRRRGGRRALVDGSSRARPGPGAQRPGRGAATPEHAQRLLPRVRRREPPRPPRPGRRGRLARLGVRRRGGRALARAARDGA